MPPPFFPFFHSTPRAFRAKGAKTHTCVTPCEKRERSFREENDNERQHHRNRPRGRPRRPKRHAMPAMPAQLPVRLPAMPPMPVPAAAPVAAMARLAVASAVAADADLVLTRTIAPRRARFAAGHPARRARKRAKHRERSPFPPESGGEAPPGAGSPHESSPGGRPEGVPL